MSIPPGQIAGRSTEAHKLAAAQAEKDLFERAGLEQPEEDDAPTDGQRALAAEKFMHLSSAEVLKLNTNWTRQGLTQLMGLRREMSNFRTVQQMQSSTLHELCDTLAKISRQPSHFEQQGILPGELAANPDLNPLLGKSQTRRFSSRIQYALPTFSLSPPIHQPASGPTLLRELRTNCCATEIRHAQQ